ncbi:MAG: helix-turn-helix transcriptional regulator, partial [Planctomycetes bacterium]|nr:helix-turn-helix transcriptional regulator [Planctomycetota bacterium]
MNLDKRRYLSVRERASYRSLEDVIGCKWSAAVVAAIREGVRRPGSLERFIPGISTKVLNERLRKLLAYGLVTRAELAGRVPHVEYALTP